MSRNSSAARRLLGLACVLGSVAVASAGLQAGERPVPREIADARYVALAFDVGDALIAEWAPDDPRVWPDDRDRLATLRTEIESWGRYKVVSRPGQAELVIAIRGGRGMTLGGGTAPMPKTTSDRQTGRTFRGEAGSSEDALFVYSSMSRGTPLWRGQMAGGLSGSPSPLFERLRADVDRTAPRP